MSENITKNKRTSLAENIIVNITQRGLTDAKVVTWQLRTVYVHFTNALKCLPGDGSSSLIQRSIFELETLNLLRADNLVPNLPQVLFILRKYVLIIKSLNFNAQQWNHYENLERAWIMSFSPHRFEANFFANTTPLPYRL
jgi:hypothetical protein